MKPSKFPEHPAERPKKKYPVITISREFGAHGATLAELSAQRMDFKFWDKELLVA